MRWRCHVDMVKWRLVVVVDKFKRFEARAKVESEASLARI